MLKWNSRVLTNQEASLIVNEMKNRKSVLLIHGLNYLCLTFCSVFFFHLFFVTQVALVVSALRDATVSLCLDTNGNHVVQRLLQHLGPSENAFVFEVRSWA